MDFLTHPLDRRVVSALWVLCAASLACGGGGVDATSDSDASVTGDVDASDSTDSAATTDGADAEPDEICDGSAGLRFAMYLPTSVERVEPASYVLWENGARFLFVFGDCSYWVSGPDNPTRSERYRSGQLAQEDAQALAQTFHFGRWRDMALTGYWHPSPEDFDLPTTVFYDGVDIVVCSGGCNALGVRAEVHAMRDAEQGWIETLWTAGSSQDGPLRVVAVRIADDDPTYDAVPAASWPLATPLATLAFPEADAIPQEAGHSLRVDAVEAGALIGIWTEYLAGAHGELWRSHASIPLYDDAQGPRYRVFIRDSIPLEDDLGLIDAPDIR